MANRRRHASSRRTLEKVPLLLLLLCVLGMQGRPEQDGQILYLGFTWLFTCIVIVASRAYTVRAVEKNEFPPLGIPRRPANAAGGPTSVSRTGQWQFAAGEICWLFCPAARGPERFGATPLHWEYLLKYSQPSLVMYLFFAYPTNLPTRQRQQLLRIPRPESVRAPPFCESGRREGSG